MINGSKHEGKKVVFTMVERVSLVCHGRSFWPALSLEIERFQSFLEMVLDHRYGCHNRVPHLEYMENRCFNDRST